MAKNKNGYGKGTFMETNMLFSPAYAHTSYIRFLETNHEIYQTPLEKSNPRSVE